MTPLSLYVRLRINLFLLILFLLANKSWSQTACNAHFNHYAIHNPDSVHFYPTGTTATHYYWTFGDGTTSTSRDPWHFYLHPGVYNICLTISDSVTGRTCTWCDTVIVTFFQSNVTVTVNPNPMNRFTSVSLFNIIDPVVITIYNFTGQLVYKKENLLDCTFNINTEEFLQGIYYYTVSDNKNFISKGKLIVFH